MGEQEALGGLPQTTASTRGLEGRRLHERAKKIHLCLLCLCLCCCVCCVWCSAACMSGWLYGSYLCVRVCAVCVCMYVRVCTCPCLCVCVCVRVRLCRKAGVEIFSSSATQRVDVSGRGYASCGSPTTPAATAVGRAHASRTRHRASRVSCW